MTDNIMEVPSPLDKWNGRAKIDGHNAELLQYEVKKPQRLRTSGKISALFGAKNEVKEAENRLQELNAILNEGDVETLLDEYGKLKDEIEQYRVDLFNLSRRFQRADDPDEKHAIVSEAKTIKANLSDIRKDKKILSKRLKPYRKILAQRDKVKSRLEEHYAAIREEAREKQDVLNMDKEARLIAERIIIALNRLNFYHRTTKRDAFGNVQIKKDHVRFERIVCTPDKVFLKVDVSRLGLLGGHIDNLPHDVYAQDICTEKVLNDLSVALERPVTSPNRQGDAGWHQGVWYEVDRLGLRDGLQSMVKWTDIMKRYPEDKRDKMPVPMGIKSGRKINWVYLAEQPHMMINGVTGFGKSNTMQMVLATLISKHSPDEVKFITIDMKNSGDFRWFTDVPHNIGTGKKPHEALELIERTYYEMVRRQTVTSKIAHNIEYYNSLVAKEDRLPHIYFVFDEYAGLQLEPAIKKEVDTYANIIAMQGRSSGIHLIVSGQQSYSSDIPRLVSGNTTIKFTARQSTVSGAMATTGTRETLKMENIKGRFMCIAGAEHFQVQMPYLDIERGDMKQAVRDAHKWAEPRPFELPPADKREPDNVESIPTMTDEQLVIMAAFKLFRGKLKQRDIWEEYKNDISLPRTQKAIKRIVERGTVEHEGVVYEPVKVKGGAYQLVEVDDANEFEGETLSA